MLRFRVPLAEIDLPCVAELRALLDAHDVAVDLLVDMGGVRFCDSSGIGALIDTLKRHRAAGSRFAVTGLQPQVRHVFDMMGVLAYLETDLDAA
jgi:anti-sigma B factor antagonist